jgi:hypothetical protein
LRRRSQCHNQWPECHGEADQSAASLLAARIKFCNASPGDRQANNTAGSLSDYYRRSNQLRLHIIEQGELAGVCFPDWKRGVYARSILPTFVPNPFRRLAFGTTFDRGPEPALSFEPSENTGSKQNASGPERVLRFDRISEWQITCPQFAQTLKGDLAKENIWLG